MSVLIKNATIVNAEESRQGDLLVANGLIDRIAPKIDVPADRVIDASGNYLIPGGIDVHTHMNIDVGIAKSCDDFYSGTVAAAFGGTTTIVDHMGFGPAGCSLHHQLEVYKEWAADQAVIDYSFHGTIQHINDDILDEMASMVDDGISSFKLYLTYGYKLGDSDVLKALLRLNELNALTCVHPENDSAVNFLRKRMLASGQTDPIFHALSRPAECEAEAISRMINLAALADAAPLYIVHLSNSAGLDYIRLAQQKGQPVFAETCPQYLFLDMQRYQQKGEEGLKYILSPPLREAWNQDKLWAGMNDGSIDTVATDHCTFTLEQKRMGLGDFTKCPNGLPGVETRLPLMFSEGVMKGRMSINRFVELVSAKPAKMFGMYPQKGVIREGADADLVLIDPAKEVTITKEKQHGNCDYTPYEGFKLQGYPVLTMLRGSILVENDQFHGEAGQGRFIRRKQLDEKFRLRR
ncbi:dihydropyrimidinase [Sansalvadorimonas sp. 2012CJ34-2]|uniref:Dihydropyrimidinase n=1 Tax=Parendozoicomonas callyspongiae TaxID=2942213 RepID=A0ABT0PKI8_9GAMM|nr:dihydropyrimidinase [Sansalvadorimonas sp. 2012CJ34-2]MCL6271900.1 dihydropyrimidinase [Sansalvadorimonas sp. 2012CJ34-2]